MAISLSHSASSGAKCRRVRSLDDSELCAVIGGDDDGAVDGKPKDVGDGDDDEQDKKADDFEDKQCKTDVGNAVGIPHRAESHVKIRELVSAIVAARAMCLINTPAVYGVGKQQWPRVEAITGVQNKKRLWNGS